MLQQSAREHVCLDVCGVRRDDEREAALDVRSAAAPTPARRDEDLDHAVYHRLVPAVEQATDEADTVCGELVLRPPAEADREERPDGLRRGARERHDSTGVALPPRPRTMSHV